MQCDLGVNLGVQTSEGSRTSIRSVDQRTRTQRAALRYSCTRRDSHSPRLSLSAPPAPPQAAAAPLDPRSASCARSHTTDRAQVDGLYVRALMCSALRAYCTQDQEPLSAAAPAEQKALDTATLLLEPQLISPTPWSGPVTPDDEAETPLSFQLLNAQTTAIVASVQ